MYTANITQANDSDTKGIFIIDVEYFKDGVSFSTIYYRLSEPSSIKELVKRQIAQYEKVDAVDLSSLVGPVDLSDPIESTPVLNTPVDAKPEEVATLQRYKRAIDLGVLASDNSDYLTLKKKIETNLSDYLTLM